MMKKFLVLSGCLLAGILLRAQSKEYFNLTQLSFMIGEENKFSPAKSNMTPSVVIINGCRYDEFISIGIGVGMTALSYPVFPLFADIRFTLFKGNLSPVLALKGGYSFAKSKKEIFENDYYNMNYKNSGGGMFNPEIGIKIGMTDRSAFMLTIGYWYQHVKSEMTNKQNDYYYNQTHNRSSDLNRLSFSIGFMFW
jgi:hypothetical protein